MKVKKSPLKLLEFNVLNSNFGFHQPQVDSVDLIDLFEKYEIDFDFVLRRVETGENFMFVKININDVEKPLSGYVIFVESVSVFEMDTKSKLSSNEKDKLIFESGLSIAINNLRSYISNTTCYFPMGRFDLPALDVNDLLIQKKKQPHKK